MKKGIDPLLGAVFLIIITVVGGIIVSDFSAALGKKSTDTAVNSTQDRLNCRHAQLYIKNVTYTCNNNCNAGTAHNLTVELVNSGNTNIIVNQIAIINTTGSVSTLDFSATTLSSGQFQNLTNMSSASCMLLSGTINELRIASTNCPVVDALPGNQILYVLCP